MTCKKCFSPIKDGDLFCGKCAHPTRGPEVSASPEAAGGGGFSPVAVSAKNPQPQPPIQYAQERETPKKPPLDRKKTIAIASGAAAVIILLIALIIILPTGNNEGDDISSVQAGPPEIGAAQISETAGTRSDPHQFGDDIVFTASGRIDGDNTTTYTLNFTETFIGEDEVFGDFFGIVGSLSIHSDETDGSIPQQIGFELFTDSMVSYNVSMLHDNNDRNAFIHETFSGATYDILIRTNLGDIENLSSMNFAFLQIREFNSTFEGESEIWVALPEPTERDEPVPDSEAEGEQETEGFTIEEIEEIDTLLQGTWTVRLPGDLEPVYVFNDGRVTVEANMPGASAEINTGSYEIGRDRLGNGLLTLHFDNGVEGELMFTFRDGELNLIFIFGDNLYQMGKISDDVELEGSFWTLNYFVDDFNQQTDERFITNNRELRGTFSNTATTNARVDVMFLVYENPDSDQEIAFVLLEYGRNPVNNSSTRFDIEFDISMRAGDGSDHEIEGFIPTGGDRIFIDWAYHQTVIDALSGSGEVMFRIIQSDRPTTSYLFTVEASNFANLYQEMFGN